MPPPTSVSGSSLGFSPLPSGIGCLPLFFKVWCVSTTFDRSMGVPSTVLIENGDGPGPGGARGMGEGGILPMAPAVANALAAGYGVRVRDLPLTPERVWRALQTKQREK